MTTVLNCFDIARGLLKDDLGLTWTDAILFPKLTLAERELIQNLALNGLAPIRKKSTPILVPAGSTVLANPPVDMIEPISIMEYAVGDTPDKSILVTKTDFIPDLQLSDSLRYWAWQQYQILFLGGNTDRNIIIEYYNAPSATMDVNAVEFPGSETFLGPRVAALCLIDSPLYATVNGIAEYNASVFMRTMVKRDQNLPVRKRPFSYALRSRRGY